MAIIIKARLALIVRIRDGVLVVTVNPEMMRTAGVDCPATRLLTSATAISLQKDLELDRHEPLLTRV